MFTGIIEEVGTIKGIKPAGNSIHLQIQARKVIEDVKLGDSIAVNGICLTVTRFSDNGFEADVVPETMRRTALSALRIGSKVNLERAMQVGNRFGGHIVSGHIDGVGTIVSIDIEDNAKILTIEAEPEIVKYVIQKGSITVDGISLTVMDRNENQFRVSIIPHTAQMTTLNLKKTGDPVNLECDMIAKYVEQFVRQRFGADEQPRKQQGLTIEYLREHGFVE